MAPRREAECTVALKAPTAGNQFEHSGLTDRSEGFALTGYDIPGCVEDGAWMLWENSSVVAVVVAVVVAHPDLENGQFSSFITKSEHPECTDRSVSSSGCRSLCLCKNK